MKSKEEFWAELEQTGVDEVRARLAQQLYGVKGRKTALAEEWVRCKDQERKDSSLAEQIAIARDASEAAKRAASAAERQAEAADRANTKATIALTIAVVAAIAAIIQIFSN